MNLILGAVKNMDMAQIDPFLISLRKTDFEGEVIFFVTHVSPETRSGLQNAGVGVVSVDDEDAATKVQINCLRYFTYKRVLDTLSYRPRYVMLSDIRDVVFQSDPFAFEVGERLCCFLEDARVTIGSSETNTMWIERAYGPSALAALKDCPVSCSGTTIGAFEPVRQYLDYMTRELAALDDRDASIISTVSGIDQGVHNYLLHTGQFTNVAVFPNETGPVLTMGYMAPEAVRCTDGGIVLNAAGAAPNVVHQYNHHPVVVDRVFARLRRD